MNILILKVYFQILHLTVGDCWGLFGNVNPKGSYQTKDIDNVHNDFINYMKGNERGSAGLTSPLCPPHVSQVGGAAAASSPDHVWGRIMRHINRNF